MNQFCSFWLPYDGWDSLGMRMILPFIQIN